jgi:hypothetical protein
VVLTQSRKESIQRWLRIQNTVDRIQNSTFS